MRNAPYLSRDKHATHTPKSPNRHKQDAKRFSAIKGHTRKFTTNKKDTDVLRDIPHLLRIKCADTINK